ncbi:MAG: phosphate ABC transporter permease subunit PstC [Actinomycetota bacterium]|jgi:phosphate transport system permease protein
MISSKSVSGLNGHDFTRGVMPRVKSGRFYSYVLRGSALLFSAVLVLFVWSIIRQSWPAWSHSGLSIITGTNWAPADSQFGALPLILATLITAGVALLFAVPIGIGTALTLNYIIPPRIASPLTVLVELLAAVPSVVYGLWGLNVLVPWMSTTIQPWLAGLTSGGWPFSGNAIGLGLVLASTVLSIMVLPTIVAISRDVIAAVPRDLIEGALSLGATRSQVLLKVVVPSAKIGLLGAVSLGAGRALGETVAVAMVIGSSPSMPHSLFSLGSTLASTIATQFIDSSPQQLAALGALAMILMFLTASVNAIARALVQRGVKG